MSPAEPQSTGPLRFAEVFREELEVLRQKASGDSGHRLDLGAADGAISEAKATSPPGPDGGGDPASRAYWVAWDEATTRLYESAGKAEQPLSALCLSGGGIRSATFNLGVMQAFAQHGLLSKFDYLSSVSGGGYIAGWLQAWIARWGEKRDALECVAALGKVPRDDGTIPRRVPSSPHAPEPRTVEHLREYGNYLTPRLGLFSGDSWAVVAIVLRNVLLNWLVFLPILAGAMGVPVMAVAAFGLGSTVSLPPMVAALALAVVGSAASFILQRRSAIRPSAGGAEKPAEKREASPAERAASRRREARARRAGSIGSAILLALAAALLAWSVRPAFGSSLSVADPRVLGVAAAWTLGAPLAGWLVATVMAPDSSRRTLREAAALGLSGAAAGVALLAVVRGWDALRETWGWLGAHAAAPFAVVAPPILLLALLLARSLFIAGTSHGEDTRPVPGAATGNAAAAGEAGREWWARHSGMVLMAAFAWAVLVSIAGAGPWLIGSAWSAVAPGAVWVGAGAGASLAGMGAKVPFGREVKEAAGKFLRQHWIVVAAAVALLALLAILGRANDAAGRAICSAMTGQASCDGSGSLVLGQLVASVALLGFGLLLGRAVDVNRFSLQGLYRNRLVRAFLGASRGSARDPDPFSGFDPDDDRPLASLNPAGSKTPPHPLSIFNGTLNLVAGRKLAWQERKGESFSMTPLFCGNFHDGYRRTAEYAGSGGISLGTAVAISGAAASPNMGYHSSPLVTFVMALFNARLGSWLPNPGARGDFVQRSRGPRNAAFALLRELFGRTDGEGKYVNLSDGGHFDNLGLYEAVLRRCRLIVVSDASDDGRARFEELGNAIRKIRIDFGIRIDFENGLGIRARGRRGEGYAIARIHYEDVDEGTTPGVLVYLKPTVAVKGLAIPADVRAYARRSRSFPHESTADQWFSESQFESYRRLGEFLADASIVDLRRSAGASAPADTPGELRAQALGRLAPAPAPQSEAGAPAPMGGTE